MRNPYAPSRTYSLNLPLLRLTGMSGATFVLAMLVLLPLMFAVANGLVMVLFGVVHSFWPAVPALGFWHTAVVYFLVQVLTRDAVGFLVPRRV